MTSKAEEQAERVRTLENDRRLREQQTGTYLSHTHDEALGRYREIGQSNVIGSTAIPAYPAASSSWQIQLPDEPPLGLDNPALEPSMSVEARGPADAPASPLDVERAGASLSCRSFRRIK